MLVTCGYPVMIFGENMIPTEHQSNASFGLLPTAVRSLRDLKPIIYSQNNLSMRQKIQYSLLISFFKPTSKSVKQIVNAIQDPTHQLHNIRKRDLIDDPSFWVEMHVTSTGGQCYANLLMPAGMGEVAAEGKLAGDFSFLILAQALTQLHQRSVNSLDLGNMRCVIPLAEIRVRDIVSYRNLKVALRDAGIENVAVRGANVQGDERLEAITQPLLVFCAECIKLSTKHRRCRGCKIAHYCSTKCQKNDWLKVHKFECKKIQEEQKEWDETFRTVSLD